MAIIENKALCGAEAVKTVTHRTHKIDLTLTEFGDGKVVIDGMDLSYVVSAETTLHNDLRRGPVLVVRVLGAIEAHVEGQVEVDAATAQALELLGWTPPVTDA